ncbi:MAG TPA: metalloregulator ArsR/SmtB family transcription factor [Devosia sp.]|uniref:metalloregulator ArsR/SmtB family transcription factor n=1 Tax=Devosia TaxID=46913 RepID=UPI000A55D2AF|nr:MULTISPECIES: metalloregulator ArsR/SmtB family transcription factor [Devosia]MBO9589496.1 winged helix-turn-helix transcriptional regulator [Devosia sp.]MCR6633560.1 metalloregulator ArsR/SmtB family transcription factor [Devosia sp.]HWV22446.1 metalloregulator ArsR/SmtB family transcription factor [Devosia sp.]
MGINAVFEALSHPVRRKVLALLKSGPKSAGELADHFELSRPTLSVHFAKLKEADLVAVERQGTSLIYHLNTSVLEQALADVLSLREEK